MQNHRLLFLGWNKHLNEKNSEYEDDYVLRLRYLSKNFSEIYLISYCKSSKNLTPYKKFFDNVHSFCLSGSFISFIIKSLIFIKRHRNDLDVVVSQDTKLMGFIGVLAKAMFNKKFYAEMHSYDVYSKFFYTSLKSFVFKAMHYLSIIFADKLRVVSDEIFEELPNFIKQKAIVLPAATFVDKSKKPSKKQDIVLFVGSLTRLKNPLFFAYLAKYCYLQRKNLYAFYMIGEGDYANFLKSRFKDLPNLKFLGLMDKSRLFDYYAKSKYLVVCSYYEGFPRVVLEAMNYDVGVLYRKNLSGATLVEKLGGRVLESHLKAFCNALLDNTPARINRNLLARYSFERIMKNYVEYLRG